MALLVVDVGNTNTVVGVFDRGVLQHHWRIQTHQHRTGDEYGLVLRQLLDTADLLPRQIAGVIISCVVPPMVRALREMCRRTLDTEPVFVGIELPIGMPILCDNPREVGADRIVNAVAGYHRHQRALIICDFGTATTFDAISPQGEYVGGVIAPGIQISAEALFQKASMLPRVDISPPNHVVGRNTIDSMKSGLLYGYSGLVGEIIRRMAAEMGDSPYVIATGGLAELISSETPGIDQVEPHLTLEGLRIIWDAHKNR